MSAKCNNYNVVFILADQLRPDFLGCYGADFAQTPNIDRLAASGIRYTNAYSPSPICVPARAGLLTGISPLANRVIDNSHWIHPAMHTWPSLLTRAGYQTAAIGKMHFYPWDASEGFSQRIIAEDKRHFWVEDDYQEFLQRHGYGKKHADTIVNYRENLGAIVSDLPADLQVDVFVGDKSKQYLQDVSDEKPFALMVGFPGPHCPYDPPQELLTSFPPADMPPPIPDFGHTPRINEQIYRSCEGDWCRLDFRNMPVEKALRMRSHYAALVHQIDVQVGKIVDTLAERGLLEKTVIIFASDHGDMLGDHGLPYKNTFYEASIKVPLIVRWPGVSGGQVVEDLVDLLDVTATILSAAGHPIPSRYDSVVLPGLPISTEKSKREYIYGATNNGMMVRTEEWKLVSYITGEALLTRPAEDEEERRNYICDSNCQAVINELYATMVTATLQSVQKGAWDLAIPDLSSLTDETFALGRRHRKRRYPTEWEE